MVFTVMGNFLRVLKRWNRFFTPIFILGLGFSGATEAQFGTAGIVKTAIGNTASANSVLIQSDGKIVAGGYFNNSSNNQFAMVRYETDGSLDNTLGIIITPLGAGDTFASSLAVQSDGKLLMGGSAASGTNTAFALVRYNGDGIPDGTFGTGGKVVTVIGTGDSSISYLVLQPDGKIIAAGDTNWHYGKFALARYNTDGSLDTTFGSGGAVVTQVGIGYNWYPISCALLQPDGKVVAAGSANADGGDGGSGQYAMALVRYNADGSLDTSFGSGGIVMTFVGSQYTGVDALVLQPDGKLVAASHNYTFHTLGTCFVLVRYNSDGSVDTGFGDAGMVKTLVGGVNAGPASLVLQPDGKLVAAGNCTDGSVTAFALARYLADGSLDASFGNGGTVISRIGVGNSSCHSLVLQGDGMLVAAGDSYIGSKLVFTLARYHSDGSLDLPPSSTATPSVTPTSSDTSTTTPTPSVTPTASSTPTTTPTPSITPTFVPGTSTTTPTSTPTFTPESPTYTPTFTMPGNVPTPQYIYEFDAQTNTVKVYDKSNPSQILVTLPGDYKNWVVYISENFVHLVNGHGVMETLDITDRSNPSFVARYPTGGEAVGISGYGHWILVADGERGVEIYDATAPASLHLVRRIISTDEVANINARMVTVADKRAEAFVWLADRKFIVLNLEEYSENTIFPLGGYATPNPFLPLRGQKAQFNFHFVDPLTPYVIRVYSLRGRLQRTLSQIREWDGRNESGNLCEGGVYVYQIEAQGKRVSGKVVLIK